MLNLNRSARPARLDTSGGHAALARLDTFTDKSRAPVTFVWWAYGQGDCPGQQRRFHLETLYKLSATGDGKNALQRTEFASMTLEQMREYLCRAQDTFLPQLPAGHRWIGPEVAEDIGVMLAPAAMGKAGSLSCYARPTELVA